RRPDVRRPGRLRGGGRSGRAEGAPGAGGQRRVARGRAAGGAAERGPPLPAAVHPGVAAGRALVAAGPGGGCEPDDRADRPPPVDPPGPPVLPGRAPGGRAAGGRVPLGHPAGTVTIQHDPVSDGSRVREILPFARDAVSSRMVPNAVTQLNQTIL